MSTDVLGMSTLLQISNTVCSATWRRARGDHGYRILWRHCALSIPNLYTQTELCMLTIKPGLGVFYAVWPGNRSVLFWAHRGQAVHFTD